MIHNEKQAIAKISEKILLHESDFKCFIGERKPLNEAQYVATICVIVPIVKAETVFKEIMRLVTLTSFRGSSVESSDERGVDILLFDITLEIFEANSKW